MAQDGCVECNVADAPLTHGAGTPVASSGLDGRAFRGHASSAYYASLSSVVPFNRRGPSRKAITMQNHPLLDTRTLQALVQASAYGEPPHGEAQPMRHPELLLADILAARVDLYCDHNGLAVADIRAARRHLQEADPAVQQAVLMSLNRAAWLTRHDDFDGAQAALEDALMTLRSTLPH